jgi:hypothetical protein
MGIDIYLEWDGMTEKEKDKQYTGFVPKGKVGYLREAYHGGPYPSKFLITENWERQPEEGFSIPNKVLRKRLPKVIKAIITRETKIYKASPRQVKAIIKEYKDFVNLHGRLEKQGKNPRIIVSY